MKKPPPSDQASVSPNEALVGRNGHSLQILIVEDEEQAARGMAQLLALEGFRAEIAGDGPAALQSAEANPPDVVLLDLGLPGMDGYEVARQLLEQKPKKRPLLIAVTGFAEEAERLRSYQVGIDLHLTKPVSIVELRQFLDRYQTIRRSGS